MKKNVVVTLCYGKSFERLGKLTIQRMEEYAKKCDADFIIWNDAGNYSHVVFKKYDIYNLFKMGYDRVLFLDLDIIVKKDAENIFDIVPYDKIGMFNETPLNLAWYSIHEVMNKYNKELVKLKRHKETINPTKWDKQYFNVGVIVASKCHMKFFEKPFVEIIDMFPEQGLMNFDRMRLNIPFYDIGYKFNALSCPILNKFITKENRIKNCDFIHLNFNTFDDKCAITFDYLKDIEKIEKYGYNFDIKSDFEKSSQIYGLYENLDYIKNNSQNLNDMIYIANNYGSSLEIFNKYYKNIYCFRDSNLDKSYEDNFDLNVSFLTNVFKINNDVNISLDSFKDCDTDFLYIDYRNLKNNVFNESLIKKCLKKIKPNGYFGGFGYINNNWFKILIDKMFGQPDVLFDDGSFLIKVDNRLNDDYFNKNSKKFITPDVSVVVPCYNDGKYLDECIDSILNQTFKNLEIIIVDDNSTDLNTRQIVKNQIKKANNIKYYFNYTNTFVAGARNNGIKLANGKYIIPIDADNYMRKDCVEKFISFSKIKKEDIIYCVHHRFGCGENNDWGAIYNWKTLPKANQIPECALFKKDHWYEVGGYNDSLYSYEDWEFWINMGKHGHYGYHIGDALYYYRVKENSLFKRCQKDHDKLVEQIKNLHPELYK